MIPWVAAFFSETFGTKIANRRDMDPESSLEGQLRQALEGAEAENLKAVDKAGRLWLMGQPGVRFEGFRAVSYRA